MKPDAFLDTNVMLRQILNDHPDHSPRANALFHAIEQGQRAVRISDTVVFEIVFTLEKRYHVSRSDVREAVQPLLDLAGIELPGKHLYRDVFRLWIDHRSLSFADCYHALFAQQIHLSTIISFDQALGRVPGLTRIEP